MRREGKIFSSILRCQGRKANFCRHTAHPSSLFRVLSTTFNFCTGKLRHSTVYTSACLSRCLSAGSVEGRGDTVSGALCVAKESGKRPYFSSWNWDTNWGLHLQPPESSVHFGTLALYRFLNFLLHVFICHLWNSFWITQESVLPWKINFRWDNFYGAPPARPSLSARDLLPNNVSEITSFRERQKMKRYATCARESVALPRSAQNVTSLRLPPY